MHARRIGSLDAHYRKNEDCGVEFVRAICARVVATYFVEPARQHVVGDGVAFVSPPRYSTT